MSIWEEHYQSGNTPWDIGHPDALLAEAIAAAELPRGRALEIGCGTGTNARFLAAVGWTVVAVDLSPTAIKTARARGEAGIHYAVHDILSAPLPGGPFDLVFDRGCFHVFDRAEDQATFAARVAAALRPGGCWLSIAGSTEGPARDGGPPRRSARDLLTAIEPVLELLSLRALSFTMESSNPAAWRVLSRHRTIPAQPSTRR